MAYIGKTPTPQPLTATDIPDLPATKITSGTFPALNGSNLTNISAGKILQVVQGNTTTTVQHATSYGDTNLSASITPSSSSNKVLIMIQQACFTGGNSGGSIKLLRGSTSIYTPSENYAFYGDGSSLDLRNYHCFNFLDTPSTTSATTYKTQGISYNSTAFKTNSSFTSFITLMEVSA